MQNISDVAVASGDCVFQGHVGYAIPTELFAPFVSSAVDVVRTMTSDSGTAAPAGDPNHPLPSMGSELEHV